MADKGFINPVVIVKGFEKVGSYFNHDRKPEEELWIIKCAFGKILGEVSPEATFVKDGKEYEVQGVKIMTGNTEPCGNTVSHEYKLVFEVKCLCCGTFK